MELGGVPASERVHIVFYGKRNAGKSSLINAVTGQSVSIVSDVLGTTTDPVSKTMELLPMGPVVIIDTPGIDDVGELGMMRVEKAYKTIERCDVAVVVIDAVKGISDEDHKLIEFLKNKNVSYIICYNKADIAKVECHSDNELCVSAEKNININELKLKIASLSGKAEKYIIRHMLSKDDVVVLVMPIDSGAPKGRIILPQQLVLREVLDSGCVCVCVQPPQLNKTLQALNTKPKVVITDSQAFSAVSEIVPDDVFLTSFSILFLNYKGELSKAVSDVETISKLKDGDKVLIAEGCTHHRQCDDIGTVKIPNLIRKFTGRDIEFEFCSGRDFPDNLSQYKIILQCGGCMLTEKEIRHRTEVAKENGIPMTNYGIALAYLSGILERAVKFYDI